MSFSFPVQPNTHSARNSLCKHVGQQSMKPWGVGPDPQALVGMEAVFT